MSIDLININKKTQFNQAFAFKWVKYDCSGDDWDLRRDNTMFSTLHPTL